MQPPGPRLRLLRNCLDSNAFGNLGVGGGREGGVGAVRIVVPGVTDPCAFPMPGAQGFYIYPLHSILTATP